MQSVCEQQRSCSPGFRRRFAERGAGWGTPSPTSALEYSLLQLAIVYHFPLCHVSPIPGWATWHKNDTIANCNSGQRERRPHAHELRSCGRHSGEARDRLWRGGFASPPRFPSTQHPHPLPRYSPAVVIYWYCQRWARPHTQTSGVMWLMPMAREYLHVEVSVSVRRARASRREHIISTLSMTISAFGQH